MRARGPGQDKLLDYHFGNDTLTLLGYRSQGYGPPRDRGRDVIIGVPKCVHIERQIVEGYLAGPRVGPAEEKAKAQAKGL